MKKLLISGLALLASLAQAQDYNIYNSSPVDTLTVSYQVCICGAQCVDHTTTINKDSVEKISVQNLNKSTVFNITKATVSNSSGSYQFTFPTHVTTQGYTMDECTDQIGDFLLMPFDKDESVLCIANSIPY